MKKNTMMRIASVLLVAVLLSTCVISGTYAKYTSTVTTSDSARVAYWGFNSSTVEIALFDYEDDGLIASKWSQGEGRTAPKKMYEATETGREENLRRQILWQEFVGTINTFLTGGKEDE